MHPIVKAGLEVMRDPATCQALNIYRTLDGCMCAVGCLQQGAVNLGNGIWEDYQVDGKTVAVEFNSRLHGEERDREFGNAMMELSATGMGTGRIINMNDDKMPLPAIADYIEERYAARETL